MNRDTFLTHTPAVYGMHFFLPVGSAVTVVSCILPQRSSGVVVAVMGRSKETETLSLLLWTAQEC
jgi:hypothetical protein